MSTPRYSLERFVHAGTRAITLHHHVRPYPASAAGPHSKSYRAVAGHYLTAMRTRLGLGKQALATAAGTFTSGLAVEASQFRFAMTKVVANTRVVSFQRSFMGLPVWREGVNVRMFNDRLDVVSSSSTATGSIRLPHTGFNEKELEDPNNKKALTTLKRALTGSSRQLRARLGALAEDNRSKLREIFKRQPVIFRYDKALRTDPEHAKKPRRGAEGLHLAVKLPRVPAEIKDGSYRVCTEVFFEMDTPTYGPVAWRALIDVHTGAVVYIRANMQAVDGLVFTLDPEQLSGDSTLTPASPVADLNPLRANVELEGLTAPAAGAQQDLNGEYVVVQNIQNPNVAPPTEAVGTDFDYEADTDDCAAVNAYYHMDSLFRMVDDFGLDTATYFAGSNFPIPVDHRGMGGAQNAVHSGNDALGRTNHFRFGLLTGSAVGYSILRAACAHEFAHGCLQNNINDGVFSWCHGFGDALGVVLCDPESLAPDRFLRSPFMTSGAGTRRHDRDVTAGFAWGGSRDAAGAMERRQIMSTTMFRAYRSTGGDSEHGNAAVQLDRRSFASRYMSFLMLGGVGTMTPVAPPAGAIDFETAVMDFDRTNPDFEGHPGGAFHKVVRWAFEKQGLHKLPGDPADGEGAPPAVDVYIDDGRNGEYEYRRNFWNTTDIWSAQVNDSTVGHQTPLVGVTNYFFVRIRNRGQDTANDVVVRAYHCMPGTGLVWPVDWTPMDTPEIAVGTLAAGAETVVGPFEWTPTNVGHECLLASVSAAEDESNADTVLGDIPHWRLVPFDNNIAQRNVSPEEPDADALTRSLTERCFQVNNPYDRSVLATLEVELPAFLRRRKWRVKFHPPAGRRIKLPPRGSVKVCFSLVPGKKFKKSDVPKRGGSIDILTTIENQVVGGMSYFVDRKLKRRLPEFPPLPEKCIPLAQKLVKCLGLKGKTVKEVRLEGDSIRLKF